MPKRRGLSISAVALLIILIVQPAGGAKPKGLSRKALDGLIEATLKAHGGRKALRAVKSLKVSGRLRGVLRRDRGSSTIYFKRPDKLHSVDTYERSREVRIVNGSKGWIKTGEAFKLAGPDFLLGMRYSLITYRLPLELAARRKDLTYLGRVEQHGRSFDVLELAYTKAIKVRVYLESESKRIAQVAGYIKVADQEVVLSNVLGDYQTVDGVAYPFHQIYYSGRTLIAEKWIEAVEANPTLPEGLFTPE